MPKLHLYHSCLHPNINSVSAPATTKGNPDQAIHLPSTHPKEQTNKPPGETNIQERQKKNETPNPKLPHLRPQSLQTNPISVPPAPQRCRTRTSGVGPKPRFHSQYSAKIRLGGYEGDCTRGWFRPPLYPSPKLLHSKALPALLTQQQLGLPTLPETAPTEADMTSTSTDANGNEEPSQTMKDLHTLLMETSIAQGALVCGNCGHEYAVKEGIANFLLPSHLV